MAAAITIILAISSCAIQSGTPSSHQVSNALDWPQITSQNRPWTRWWWMGSAVNKADLTKQLEDFKQAGIGGVEICPIYGVDGYEKQNIEFLSQEWMDMLAHTTRQAARLGLGVDMTTGTGWPFGGPWVNQQTASASVELKRYEPDQGGSLNQPLPKGQLQYLAAISADGKHIDLTEQVQDGRLEWKAPTGQWQVYAVTQKNRIQKVKRAAPGGEGYVPDPYSAAAMKSYLSAFDEAFAGYQGIMPRGQFHDSFEYYGATWTDDFFSKFQAARGYDLRTQIEALYGDAPEDIVARVRCDYRRTISDLHHEYMDTWTQWCHWHNGISRNQAHGAPGNLIDFYAGSDIPETEIFRAVDMRQIPMLKFASSAAHIKGTTLCSCESFTWLREHFNTSLDDIKEATDFLFLSGINHIFFHGITYSPQSAPWPGWQFYASVNMGPHGGLWKDLPAYNKYVARCQSILQSGKPDNDILLYYPVFDTWQAEGKDLLMRFTVHDQEQWLWPTSFYRAAVKLLNRGYAFDMVSDRYIEKAECDKGNIILGGNTYKAILVPDCRIMPLATLDKLAKLRADGATVMFENALPSDVPGFERFEQRKAQLEKIKKDILFEQGGDVRIAATDRGRWLIGDIGPMLEKACIQRERAVDEGLKYVRQSHSLGNNYFFVNCGNKTIDGWIPLAKGGSSAAILDPYSGRTGIAAMQKDNPSRVYLQLVPGQSCFVRTFTDKIIDGAEWSYFHSEGTLQTIEGSWNVEFIDGGPVLPKLFKSKKLESWTTDEDPNAQSFAGTARYTIEFEVAADDADDRLLDLGRVCESARVNLNGHYIDTLWTEPYQLTIGEYLQSGKNTLSVEVTNLAANRIRDMDRRKVKWKYFKDINVVNIDYKPLDASEWPLRDSGLLGPVRLIPLKKLNPLTDEN